MTGEVRMCLKVLLFLKGSQTREGKAPRMEQKVKSPAALELRALSRVPRASSQSGPPGVARLCCPVGPVPLASDSSWTFLSLHRRPCWTHVVYKEGIVAFKFYPYLDPPRYPLQHPRCFPRCFLVWLLWEHLGETCFCSANKNVSAQRRWESGRGR